MTIVCDKCGEKIKGDDRSDRDTVTGDSNDYDFHEDCFTEIARDVVRLSDILSLIESDNSESKECKNEYTEHP